MNKNIKDFIIFFFLLTTFFLININLLYWYLIGILGTIGIGFGLSTGALFLFPDIAKTTIINKDNSFNELFIEVLPRSIAFSIGSSMGETSAYFLSYYYPLNKIKIIENNYLYKCTKRLTQKYRGYGIFLLSCWPNMTFDACGYISGQFNISYLEFIIATILGKLFKTILQILFILNFFYSQENTKKILNKIPYIGNKIIISLNNYNGDEETINVIYIFQYFIMGIFLFLGLIKIKQFLIKKNSFLN